MSMKILATSDWHLGNLFHGNDRLPEHKHFLKWLLEQIAEQKPDALLIAGDIFDNGNPSAAAQTVYYEFLADATQLCPNMQVIITAGNHDSASRLEAPRPLLTRYHVEIRGNVRKIWQQGESEEDDKTGGHWLYSFDDLIIPVTNEEGEEVIILAVPFLRSDVVQNASYSQGVNDFLRELTAEARKKYPDRKCIMMAHMYAKGSDIARKDASEKIIIGGQEEVDLEGWNDHPDYMTCGHIHKRQHIWNTDWARYTGSILPMSFAEKDYTHGIDLITIGCDKGEKEDCKGKNKEVKVEFLEYKPQHSLRILPEDEEELTFKKWQKLINSELSERTDGELNDHFDYVMLNKEGEYIVVYSYDATGVQVLALNNDLAEPVKMYIVFEPDTLKGEKKRLCIEVYKAIADGNLTIETARDSASTPEIKFKTMRDETKEGLMKITLTDIPTQGE